MPQLAFVANWEMSPIPITPKLNDKLAFIMPLGVLIRNINEPEMIPEFVALKEAANEAATTAAAASEVSTDAKAVANDANQTATAADQTATGALEQSQLAKAAAEEAAIQSASAETSAAAAVTTATTADQNATVALANSAAATTTATTAATTATTAQTAATAAVNTATTANQSANTAVSAANAAMAQVAGIQQGTKPFDSYALLQAYTGTAPDPAKGTFIAQVVNDPDTSKNSNYTWDATNSVWKPSYNPLNEAKAYTDGFVGKGEPIANILPVFVALNRIALWLADGLLDAPGFGPNLSKFIGTANADVAPSILPLAMFSQRLATWLDNGKFDAAGFGPNLKSQIGTDSADLTSSILPLSMFSKRLATWLDNGKFDAAGFGPNLSRLIGTGNADILSSILPLSVFNSRLAVWLDNGKFDAAGFGPNLLKIVNDLVGTTKPPADSVTGRLLPLVTDGVSLRRWKGNAAKVLNNTGQLRILVTGDSWAANMKIVPKLSEVLKAKYGAAGTGWLSVGNVQLDGVLIQATGGTWSIRDIMNDSAIMPTGCGLDGYTRYSDAANITYKLTNIPNASELTIFHGQSVGSFRYRVNDGAWTTRTINETGGKVQSVTITQPNIISYELELLSGEMYLHGHLARSAAVGVEVSKAGHGGATAYDYSLFASELIPTYASQVMPDVVVVILGTNDHRLSRSPVSVFKQGLRDLVNAYRSVNPTCGFVFVAPAKTNGVALVPLSEYRDAALAMAYELEAEYYNMYDDWADFASENTNGQWGDIFHVSDNVGSLRVASTLFHKFLEL